MADYTLPGFAKILKVSSASCPDPSDEMNVQFDLTPRYFIMKYVLAIFQIVSISLMSNTYFRLNNSSQVSTVNTQHKPCVCLGLIQQTQKAF